MAAGTPASRGSWSAISRTPYLKAIALFSKGDCWNGGGLFTAERTYWLNDGLGHVEMLETPEVRRDTEFTPAQHFGGECLSVYYPRLMRDGWTATRLVTRNYQPAGEYSTNRAQ